MDITKALTIKITADDLTGGAWSKVGGAIKDVLKYTTALNQAWELGSKIYNKVAAQLGAVTEAVSRGGEFSQQAASLRSLALSYQQHGDEIVNDIRRLSNETVSLQQATVLASSAIKHNLGAETIAAVAQFASKYADAMQGVDKAQVQETLYKALASGRTKALAEFGLVIKDGEAMGAVIAQLKQKADDLGPSVFNLADSMKALGNAADGAFLKVTSAINDVIGDWGFDQTITAQFTEAMRAVEQNAGVIATGIVVPISDALGFIYDQITGPTSLMSAIVDVFDLGFAETDTFEIKTRTILRMIGNSMYDIVDGLKNTWNTVVTPIEYTLKGIFKLYSLMNSAAAEVIDFIGVGDRQDYDIAAQTAQNLVDGRIVFADTDATAKARAKYNAGLDEAIKKTDTMTRATFEAKAGLQRVGEAFDKAADSADKKAKAATKATVAVKETSTAAKQAAADYTGMADKLSSAMTALATITSKTQEGINATAGAVADFIANKFDVFSFSNSSKMAEFEKLLRRQEEAKARELAIVERQAEAQADLADAMRETADKPKIVEFRAPTDANSTERFIREVVAHLVKLAKAEGTMVQA